MVAYLVGGWDVNWIGVAVTIALMALLYTVPELVRIHRTLRTLREEPPPGDGR